MSRENIVLTREERELQLEYAQRAGQSLRDRLGRQPMGCVVTFGCQQNEADSELIRGMFIDMGFGLTDDESRADVLVFNTCAIREHAEMRVFGNVGQTSHYKKDNPDMVICVCGCMPQQPQVAEKIKKSYPYVDIVFGTHALWMFPQLLCQRLSRKKRMFDISGEGRIWDGMPPVRKEGPCAWLSIMYGCNNFCSYCIVPYVRGRERSRDPECVLAEVRELVEAGYKDITLLGQNVNSYGNDLDIDYDFSDLLRQIDEIPGEYLIRFMSSHPKDATQKLVDTMAASKHVAHQLHLPFQSGNDRVLKEMNRRYTRQQYLDLINYAKRVMPDLVLTSDVIIGFPGETEEEAMDTVSLVEEVGFDALFTFIYSPRPGTKAAEMPDPATRKEKQKWFDKLLEVQNGMSAKLHAEYIGKTVRVLVDGESDDANFPLTSRTEGNRLVRVKGDESLMGRFINVKITDSNTWALYGEPV